MKGMEKMYIQNWKEQLSKDEVYLCFSFPLFKFLEKNQVYPIAKEVHRTTNKVFTVFIKNERLQELLKQWTDNRPKKEN